MSKLLLSLIFMFYCSTVSAQNELILKAKRDASMVYHDYYPSEDRNYGLKLYNGAFYLPGHAGGIQICRALIDFDLSSIPNGTVVQKASISLYAFKNYDPESIGSLGHLGNNASYLRRITSSWNEELVTWNTQPMATTENQVILHPSIHPDENYVDIDVTELVNDMIKNPSESHGFFFGLMQEELSTNLSFHSKEGPDPSKYPELKIIYQPSALSISCSPSVKIQSTCNAEVIQAAYKNWKAGFSVTGGYITIDNLDEKPGLPANASCSGADLSFTLKAKGFYETNDLTCTSTFVVLPVPDLSINSPAPVKLETSCNSEESIQAAYESWKTGFSITGGCNTTENLNEIPPLPDDAKCKGADLTFTLSAKGDCETGALKKTSTFIVVPKQSEFDFTMYPNPGRNILKIEFKDQDRKYITMYTLEGKIVLSMDSEEIVQEIVVRDLAPGIYFVQCSNGQKTITRKYIKMIRKRDW